MRTCFIQFPRILDSPDTEWTNENHNSYLDSIEAYFVKKMYDKEYCALDLCGPAPKEPENIDPDSIESRLNFPSPFNEVILSSMITVFDLVLN